MAELFRVDLEENDLTDFDSTTNPSNMTANTDSAMVGTYGVEFTYDDVSPPRGEITTSGTWPIVSGELNARFYLDPNNLSKGSGDNFIMHSFRCDGTLGGITTFCYLRLHENGATYLVEGTAKDDSNTNFDTTQTEISDGIHYIEIYSKRASSDIASDGEYRVYIDGVETGGSQTGLDNYDLWPTMDEARLGVVSNPDATTSGTFYMDDWIATDDGNLIGPAGAAFEINVTPSDINYYTQGIRVR